MELSPRRGDGGLFIGFFLHHALKNPVVSERAYKYLSVQLDAQRQVAVSRMYVPAHVSAHPATTSTIAFVFLFSAAVSSSRWRNA